MNEEYRKAIKHVSFLISQHRSQQIHEDIRRTKNPDYSDHFIATHATAVEKLRKIRHQLEEIEAQKDYLEP